MAGRTPIRRLLLGGTAAVALAVGLSGCSLGGWVYNADLPGGAKLGSHPLTLTADFSDVLDLVPESSVKVDNVAVGRVTKIQLEPDGHSALVTLKVNRDADLVTGTTARLEQTSLLGEKYVALIPPGDTGDTGDGSGTSGDANAASAVSVSSASSGEPLQDGAHLALSSTSEAVDVEQVLGALSLVLNGGDIGQFKEISEELQKISAGRTGQIRDFLTQINRFVSTLNARRSDITGALDGLDHLSTALKGDDDKIANALDGLSPGMKVLAQQEPQLVKMLQALNKLSDVTVSTLNKSQKNMVADFKTLDPILTQLAKSGKDLPDALQILLTYPFPDSVLDAIKGDYFNAYLTTNFRTIPSGCSGIGCAWPQITGQTSGRVAAPSGLSALIMKGSTASSSPSPTSTATSSASADSDPSTLPTSTATSTKSSGGASSQNTRSVTSDSTPTAATPSLESSSLPPSPKATTSRSSGSTSFSATPEGE